MGIEIQSEAQDAAPFLDFVKSLLIGAAREARVEEVYVIRIDNWFDRKWLGFSGKRLVAKSPGRHEKNLLSVVPAHREELTLPPFSPNRVRGWRSFAWSAYAGEFVSSPAELVPHRWQNSQDNLNRRVSELGDSLGLFWFSGQSEPNGRGSAMFYVSKDGATNAWYAQISDEANWSRTAVTGISQERLDEFVRIGMGMRLEEETRKLPEEAALSRQLVRAIESGQLSEVSELIAGDVQLEQRDERGRTPFLTAISAGHWDAAKLLLDNGANPFQQDYRDFGALHLCGWKTERESQLQELLHQLLGKGVHIESRTRQGWTPLSLACWRGNLQTITTLLDEGAELGTTDKERQTPLHLACWKGEEEVVRLLLERGAKVSARDKDRETPLFEAVRSGSAECIRLLHGAGASVTVKSKKGRTPLVYAKAYKHAEVEQLLRELGASDDERN